ncbi:MAG: site-2 protease family protein [Ruminococcus sp.]|nr:site-2 protease family protein [Ruminococcus sp.]
MRLRIKGFEFSVTYPALCLFSALIIINFDYVYCLSAVIIHELAHLALAAYFRTNVTGIKISLYDIEIVEKSRHIIDYKNDLIITAAGPLANFVLFAYYYHFDIKFAWVNLFIGAFNLLPAANLDGGQILYLILSRRFTLKTTANIVIVITICVSALLFFAGILVLFESKYNFSLLLICFYLILSLFYKQDKFL